MREPFGQRRARGAGLRGESSSVQACAGRACSSVSARPTSGSRKPASQPVLFSASRSMCMRMTSTNISSESRLRTLWLPARLLFVSAVARRTKLSSKPSDAMDAPRPQRMKRGSELDQRIEWPHVATEEAADEVRVARAVTAGRQLERQRVVVAPAADGPPRRLGSHARRARQRMRVALRHHRDVAFLEPNRLEGSVIDERDPARAFRNHMILDDVLSAGRDFVGDLGRRRRFRDPRRRGGDVEKHRAGQAHG